MCTPCTLPKTAYVWSIVGTDNTTVMKFPSLSLFVARRSFGTAQVCNVAVQCITPHSGESPDRESPGVTQRFLSGDSERQQMYKRCTYHAVPMCSYDSQTWLPSPYPFRTALSKNENDGFVYAGSDRWLTTKWLREQKQKKEAARKGAYFTYHAYGN
jgi:hypothetical protein